MTPLTRRCSKPRSSIGRAPATWEGSACQKGAVVRRRPDRTGIGDEYSRLLGSFEMAWVPTVIENEGGNRERAFDIYSRLLRDRIIIVGRPIDDIVANLIVAQLIFLASEDPDKEVQMYVNSPGGAVAAGMAIYDTMQYVKPPIPTV